MSEPRQRPPQDDRRQAPRRRISRKEMMRRKKARRRKQILAIALLLFAAALIFLIVKLTHKDSTTGTTAGQESTAQASPADETAGGDAAADTDSSGSSTAASETEAEDSQQASNPGLNTSVTITCVGDCTLGRDSNADYDSSFDAYYDANGASYFWENVIDLMDSDDMTLANLECTFTTSEDRTTNIYAFKSDPSYVELLKAGSIEAVNVANNHSHDYGESGLTETEQVLDEAGIVWSGFDSVGIYETSEGVKIGMTGLYLAYSEDDQTQLLKDNIASLKEMGADLIIVSCHWGSELEYEPDEREVTYGKLAIDLGADLVVGTHPHVIQPVEKYNGKYIIYSLGNFCFGGSTSPTDPDCIMFQQTFTFVDGEVQTDNDISIIPCSVSSASGYNNYQPTILTGDDAQRVLQKAGQS